MMAKKAGEVNTEEVQIRWPMEQGDLDAQGGLLKTSSGGRLRSVADNNAANRFDRLRKPAPDGA